MNFDLFGIFNLIAAMLLAPLLSGIINRTKAVIAGRQGQPLMQLYYDLGKLFRRGTVYSHTASLALLLAPAGIPAVMLLTLALLPGVWNGALLSFNGDLILMLYLLASARFMTVLAALDTGSSFEGMGASRELQFGLLSELPFMFGLAVLAILAQTWSLTNIFNSLVATEPAESTAAVALVAAAFLMVYLTENCRVPADDPNTHLELTMIHEVMVLDYSGPDLGLILYGSALKLWLIGTVLLKTLLPAGLDVVNTGVIFLVGMFLLAVAVGMIESCIARFRLLKIPQMLVGAFALTILAVMLIIAR